MKAIDVTWLMGPVFIWSTIEPSVAIVCACLPHLAPLARLAGQSVFSSVDSQKTTTATSGRLRRLHSESGEGPQKNTLFGSRGPTFDYGLDQMKRSAHDDEIGLTNYITVNPKGGEHPSIESLSDDHPHDHSIAVQSSFVQSTSQRTPSYSRR